MANTRLAAPLVAVMVAASCGPMAPSVGPALPEVAEPPVPHIPPIPAAAPLPVMPRDRNPTDEELVELEEAERAQANACLGERDADFMQSAVYREIAQYNEAWEHRLTARRGWSRLSPARSGLEDGSPARPGHVWLKTRLVFSCSGESPHFYIDHSLGVFEVEYAPTCAQTRTVPFCGTYAAPGCGIDPGPSTVSWYVEVPQGAHWLSGDFEGGVLFRLRDQVPACFEAKPARTTTPG